MIIVHNIIMHNIVICISHAAGRGPTSAGPPRATGGPLLVRRKDTNRTIKDKRISSVRAHAIVHNNNNKIILWPTRVIHTIILCVSAVKRDDQHYCILCKFKIYLVYYTSARGPRARHMCVCICVSLVQR